MTHSYLQQIALFTRCEGLLKNAANCYNQLGHHINFVMPVLIKMISPSFQIMHAFTPVLDCHIDGYASAIIIEHLFGAYIVSRRPMCLVHFKSAEKVQVTLFICQKPTAKHPWSPGQGIKKLSFCTIPDGYIKKDL